MRFVLTFWRSGTDGSQFIPRQAIERMHTIPTSTYRVRIYTCTLQVILSALELRSVLFPIRCTDRRSGINQLSVLPISTEFAYTILNGHEGVHISLLLPGGLRHPASHVKNIKGCSTPKVQPKDSSPLVLDTSDTITQRLEQLLRL
jgi:hypothetical protein